MVYWKTRETTAWEYRLVALEASVNQLKAVDFEFLHPENSSLEFSEKKDKNF